MAWAQRTATGWVAAAAAPECCASSAAAAARGADAAAVAAVEAVAAAAEGAEVLHSCDVAVLNRAAMNRRYTTRAAPVGAAAPSDATLDVAESRAWDDAGRGGWRARVGGSAFHTAVRSSSVTARSEADGHGGRRSTAAAGGGAACTSAGEAAVPPSGVAEEGGRRAPSSRCY